MQFIWKYIDQEQTAIRALKNYPQMQTDYQLTPQTIRTQALKNIQTQTTTPNPNTPKTKTTTPDPTGQLATRLLTEQNKLQQRQHTATKYMNWFLPAWQKLDTQNQNLLEAFFLSGQPTQQIIHDIQQTTGWTKRTTYRHRKHAIKQLAHHLFNTGTMPNKHANI